MMYESWNKFDWIELNYYRVSYCCYSFSTLYYFLLKMHLGAGDVPWPPHPDHKLTVS